MLLMLVSFTAAAVVLVLLPGPDTLVVVRGLVRGGRSEGARTAIGVLCALTVWVAAASLGISALLQASRVGYDVLKVVGAGYLVWMGVRSLLIRRQGAAVDVAPARAGIRGGGFAAGFTTDILNPKIGVAFVSLLPGFIPHGYPVGWTTLGLGTFYLLLTAVYFAGLVAASRAVTTWMSTPHIRRRLDALAGVVLIGFGVRLVTEA